jgi:hypothetical protein
MNRALTHRLRRLETALAPVEPQILPIIAIASATGEVIHESQLVIYPPFNRGHQARMWARYEEIEPRLDRR